MIYGIYRLLTKLISAIFTPVFLACSAISGNCRNGMRQRFGYYDNLRSSSAQAPLIWIHGASVGEMMVARILASRINKEFPDSNLVISTMTRSGLQIAKERFGELATCIHAPLDLPGPVQRAVESIRPDIYICLETELWPSLLTQLHKHGTRLFLLNGRLSERSRRRYGLLMGLSRKILGVFDNIAAITEADAERFISLGARKNNVSVSGNVKYDLPELSLADEIRSDWQKVLGLDSTHPVLVAGSTHSGEEAMIIEAFLRLKETIPGLVLIIAPRHLNRIKEVREILADGGTKYQLLSQVTSNGRLTDIIIVDTMGELASLYSVASYTFCGGSLVSRGGHNIIEAAIWGGPVFYGPSMKDFADAKDLLEEHGAGFMIMNTDELVEKIQEFAVSPPLLDKASEAARRTAFSQQGAANRQLAPVFDAIRSRCSNRPSDH